ncbi:ABC transporter ATP-binding protein [Streptococcus panodentis]|uniref:ABC transporter ATP-binding protein n=1 Tax=Streptococcus panodentis TaxID=1581472 RepID=A0ABS5AXY0_9STRE|nr:ABC transporter ATP-binding protein [Streptococcus panodentis]MBP2621430.1 ABC transporter ATP-binding protein [Streptococcus panodentis]
MFIQARHLSKSYQENQEPIIRDLSLDIEAGQFIAVMGPSGCGKSTLLNILSTIDQPDQGQLFYKGQNLLHLDSKQLDQIRRQEFGFVFQQATFLKNLTIIDNICLPSLIGQHRREREAAYERAKELMALTGIENIAQRSLHEVSGGQLQRAGICRALINQPQLIFADEPTGALNSQASRDVMDLMQDFHQQGASILLVTHDVNAAAYADKVLLILDGQIECQICFDAKSDQKDRRQLLLTELSKRGI